MAEYVTLQEALEEAGLHHVENGVVADGVADGSNRAFSVARKPLADTDYDDLVTVDDIQVYVDGVPVQISEVNERFGTFELVEPPKSGSIVTVDYAYMSVTSEYLNKLRIEATAWINNNMSRVDPCAPYGTNGRSIPGIVSELCRNYMAARLLIREYGYNQDIEGTSKDGYKRLETVKEDLKEYMESGGECGGDGDGFYGSTGTGLSQSDGDLFGGYSDGHLYNSCDRHFERGL